MIIMIIIIYMIIMIIINAVIIIIITVAPAPATQSAFSSLDPNQNFIPTILAIILILTITADPTCKV